MPPRRRSICACLHGRPTSAWAHPKASWRSRRPWSYLACAPKSNAVYMAYKSAMDQAKKSGTLEVPMHLRNAPTRLMKDLGYGKDYQYAHDHEGGYVADEVYLPRVVARHVVLFPG